MEIPKSYDPKVAEENHYDRWESIGCFAPEINKDPKAKKFSIVIPPPNVTGSLHMGHALQHTIMDVLTRWKRMQGYRTLWLPGTDHAGISVQRKVVEQLRKDEKRSPLDIGREDFVRRAWAWKEQYGNTITEQMRREGASVDWSRHRFTMDDSLSLAVRNVFCTLYDEGWIYRGLRIVNWCPKDKTVLSDLEVKEETRKDGKLTYLRYPVKGTDRTITVATTRPETMLGDTAVAVNPLDERYTDLIGKTVSLPLTGREIPIIADDYVDPEFGTGAVKITPAHDPNDYVVGERHGLEQLLVMNDDGTMNAAAGAAFDGIDRFDARKMVVEQFESLGLLDRIEDYEVSLPICERCKTIVEPILSDQWFVKMDELRDMALDLIRTGKPQFWPQVPHEKVYTTWLENLKDWTISRQLWWGHQIPAWYDNEGNVYVARTPEEAKEKAGDKELTQDQDVLDTWFSSGLWAFSTFGWNGEVRNTPDLETFLPTDVLVTGRDIIFLWVSRMMMLTKKFVGKAAFDDVVVTGTVLGKDGKPMSKSRGNGVDPIEMFDKFGVDATRIYLASIATGADIKWNDTGVETYRNFANKIWNATRFCLLNSDGAQVKAIVPEELTGIADRWIVSRLNKTAINVNSSLAKYEFHTAVSLLYHFFWDDFCDWYIELKKDEINAGDIEASWLILSVLEQALRLLHPFMPYLTEELWQKLPGTNSQFHNPAYSSAERTIMLADFPPGTADLSDDRAENEMGSVIDLIRRVRNIRTDMNIKPSDRVAVHVAGGEDICAVFAANEAQILKLARADKLVRGDTLTVPKASAKAVIANAEIAVPLEGLIDFSKERERLQNQIGKLAIELTRLSGQLSNLDFVKKAPAEKVEALRERRSEIEIQTATLQQNLTSLE
ncbi:MAG: valine--tRNA ligase [Blastocatellia bacterium]|mgnify:CR=1 FL=1|nr:valine--tRNA ligase [Chloracidobacterium sp.]MBL8185614.1 valine--tRNA ligase [Blastocatellia bacterium]HBE81230.1 valine--tRNA ligase [Blastocatellia bacterium]HRJ89894.1 valine--tRNA ligase [Pyrinomonadaceae bacterium]HRK50771.1 valine--tRNA ligase [Pyrinomonadaceae bacterium]